MNFRVRNFELSAPTRPLPSNPNPLVALAGSLRALNGSDLALRGELDSLLQENDPALLAEGFFSLANRQELSGRLDIAQEIYATLTGTAGELTYQDRARERLAVLQGQGPFGARFEILSRNFARQASDPALLAGMFVGSAFFQAGRLAVLSRLATSPGASLFTRGLGARSLAWGAGFALEVPAFTLTVRGLHESMGLSQEWSPQAMLRDLASAGLTLFLLKGSAAAGTSLTRRLAAEPSTGIFSRFSAAAIPQVATFTGIYAAHGLEVRLGLRPQTDHGNAIVESLATLLQFHVGGRLLSRVSGNGFARSLEAMNRHLEAGNVRHPPGGVGLSLPSLRPAFAAAERNPALDHILMMTNEGEKPPQPPGANRFSELQRREKIPDHHIPIQVNPSLFEALRPQMGHLEAEMYYLVSEQRGETMWDRQCHRITLELAHQFRLLDRFLPNENDRPVLDKIRNEIRHIRNMLSEIRNADAVPSFSQENNPAKIREFISALYRVPNKGVNYLNGGNPADLGGVLQNAVDARTLLYDNVYRFIRVNQDAYDAGWADEARPLPRITLDPSDPTRELLVPSYEYRDEYESPFLEIRGIDRKVVLIGEVPRQRIGLSQKHYLEIVPFDTNAYSALASEAVTHGNLDRIHVTWREWRARTQDAHYLEGYDLAPTEQWVGAEGEQLMKELVLDRLRPGGIAFLVSRDATALQRMVQIATENEWADVVLGSYRGHLPVEVDRSDQEAGNFVFLRKLAQL